MMLDTSTRSPPSGAAMLPQKFSAATTFGRSSPPELPEPVDHAARPATASNATPIAMDLRALVITSVPHRAPTCIDRNKSRSHCQKKRRAAEAPQGHSLSQVRLRLSTDLISAAGDVACQPMDGVEVIDTLER